MFMSRQDLSQQRINLSRKRVGGFRIIDQISG
jgi:hypothetical protein